MVELHAQGPWRHRLRIRAIAHERRKVEDLEYPLEAYECGHDIDSDIGQGGQRAVELGQEGDQGQKRAQGDGSVDDKVAADPVGDGGRDGAHEEQGSEEPSVGHGDADAGVTHLGSPTGELAVLALGASEERHQQCPCDVEALRHLGAHLGVDLHLLLGEPLQASPHPARRQQKEGHEHE